MTSIAICGGDDLYRAARDLGLEAASAAPDLVVVDADDDAAVAEARGWDPRITRVFVASPSRAALLEAAGAPHVVARPLTAAALGPAIFAVERASRRAPRLLAFAAACGASGRTSLVANLAVRLAPHLPTVALDGTGSGALAWRLGKSAAPWADIVAVGEELGEGHLRVAAAECEGALVVGGLGSVTEEQLLRAIELASTLGVLLVDAPPPWLAPRVLEAADRLYVCANPDAASAALTAAAFETAFSRGARLVVSQAAERDVPALSAAFGRAPTFLLPRDEGACREAVLRRGRTGGALGRTYDAIAEIVLAELTE